MRQLLSSFAFATAIIVVACGGNVVVDQPTSGVGGSGGALNSTGTSIGDGGGVCSPTAQTGEEIIEACVSQEGGGCFVDTLASVVAGIQQPCVNDSFCECVYTFVAAPCPPAPGCCYQVRAIETMVLCE